MKDFLRILVKIFIYLTQVTVFILALTACLMFFTSSPKSKVHIWAVANMSDTSQGHKEKVEITDVTPFSKLSETLQRHKKEEEARELMLFSNLRETFQRQYQQPEVKKITSSLEVSDTFQRQYQRQEVNDIDAVQIQSVDKMSRNSCDAESIFRLPPFTLTPSLSQKRTTCPRLLKAGSPDTPRTGLLSFPGSGNTWLRHMLQQLTGIGTGAIYKDEELLRNGFPFEGEIRNVIAIKSHGVIHSKAVKYIPVERFQRIMILLRNPYNAFLSDYKQYVLKTSHLFNEYIDPNLSQWRKFVLEAVERWGTFMQDAFSFNGPVLVVFYEDLKSQLPEELVKIANFLRYKNFSEFSFCCAIKNQEGLFHRRPNKQKSEDVYNEEQRVVINGKIEEIVTEVLSRRQTTAQRLLGFKKPIVMSSQNGL